MKKMILVLALVLMVVPFVLGEGNQPTQQYNKILLSPFYVNSMTQNVQYNYSVSVVTPDGISGVKSAILTVDAWINPTRTFNAWFNGVQCNTKNYTISTTYASAGRGVVTFDCTNAVIPMQENIVTFVVTGGNIGSSTAWLDLTYFNNPVGSVAVHGTEYQVGDDAKVWLQLVNNTGGAITDGVCYVDIYTPDNLEYLEHAQMNNLNHDGVYYYDLPAPDMLGVYPVIARCYYQATSVPYFPNGNFSMTTGTAVDTTPLIDIQTQDGTFWRFNEDTNGVRRALNFTIDIGNASSCTSVSESLLTGINIYSYAKFDSVVGDNINFEIYNWSSGSWIMLPNQHLEGNVFRATSNTIDLNNVTRYGLYNSTIGGFRLRITDTNIVDGGDDDLDIDQLYVACNQLSNPAWQQVMGSSEMHISDYTVTVASGIADNVWNYSNRTLTASSSSFIGGTEYSTTETEGKVVVRMTDNSGEPVVGASCSLSVFFNQSIVLNANMTEYNGTPLGVYYIAFNLSGVAGVYPYAVDCVKLGKSYYMVSSYHIFGNSPSFIADAVWNATNRNLTFYPVQLDLTNYSRIDASINSSTLNITGLLNVMDSKLDNILTAFSNIASNVWSYFARYTHGEVLT